MPARRKNTSFSSTEKKRDIGIKEELFILVVNDLRHFSRIKFGSKSHFNSRNCFIKPAIIKTHGAFSISAGSDLHCIPAYRKPGCS